METQGRKAGSLRDKMTGVRRKITFYDSSAAFDIMYAVFFCGFLSVSKMACIVLYLILHSFVFSIFQRKIDENAT